MMNDEVFHQRPFARFEMVVKIATNSFASVTSGRQPAGGQNIFL